MATRYWTGLGSATAQVDNVTPANVEIGDIFKITLTNEARESHEISFTATVATVQNVVEGLKAEAVSHKSASTAPWDEVTVTEDDTKVIITADVAGVPFYCTTSTTDGGGNNTQTLTRSASVANAGPADWNCTANWSGTTVPVTNDTVIFDGRTTQSVTYGMDQTGVDLTKLHIMSSYTGTVGSATIPLIIQCAGNVIVQGTGDYYIQCGNDANDADIAKLIVDASSNSTIGISSQKNASAGNVGIFTTIVAKSGTLYLYGKTDSTTGSQDGTAYGTLYIVPLNGRDKNVTVYIGDQCEDYKNSTTGSIYMYNGTLYLHSDASVVFQCGGVIYNGGTSYSMDGDDDNITTLHLCGGTFYWNPSVVSGSVCTTASASPSIATANIYGGRFDASSMLETLTTAPTITALNQYNQSDINLDNGYGNVVVTTWTRFGGTQSFSTGQSVTIS